MSFTHIFYREMRITKKKSLHWKSSHVIEHLTYKLKFKGQIFAEESLQFVQAHLIQQILHIKQKLKLIFFLNRKLSSAQKSPAELSTCC